MISDEVKVLFKSIKDNCGIANTQYYSIEKAGKTYRLPCDAEGYPTQKIDSRLDYDFILSKIEDFQEWIREGKI